jgi:protein ImuB
VERLLVVWCPRLLEEHEHGREARAFAAVTQTLRTLATRVDPVRPGVCAVPTRGPSRYFGGDAVLARLAGDAVTREVAGLEVRVGVADGLFAAVLAARTAGVGEPVVVAPGETPRFLAPWPLSTLDRLELTDLLGRLGIRSLGQFAVMETPKVLARFGVEGSLCQRVARGVEGELPGLRQFAVHQGPGRPDADCPGDCSRTEHRAHQGGFWGDTAGADTRAATAAAEVQAMLGPEAVLRGRLHGGRGPSQRARLVPWTGDSTGPAATGPTATGPAATGLPADPGEPWPGQIPAPAPVVVLRRPLPVLLTDTAGRTVGVTAGGMATGTPAVMSVAGGAWIDIARWAGPWPSDERWWSIRARRRQARMQVVTTGGTAHLLTRERGAWWLEATYD